MPATKEYVRMFDGERTYAMNDAAAIRIPTTDRAKGTRPPMFMPLCIIV